MKMKRIIATIVLTGAMLASLTGCQVVDENNMMVYGWGSHGPYSYQAGGPSAPEMVVIPLPGPASEMGPCF